MMIFKEQVGPYCLAAVLVGFIGVVIMIQPWGHPFAGF